MRTLCALESICLSGFFPNPKPRRLTPMIFQVNQNSWLSTSKSLRPSLPAPPPRPFFHGSSSAAEPRPMQRPFSGAWRRQRFGGNLWPFRRTAPRFIATYIGKGSSASLTNLWLGMILFSSLVAS